MKIKNLFLAGLAVFALSACSDNDKEGLESGSDLDTYLSLTISSSSTRTEAGTEGRENATTEENKINNVTVVLTNAAGVISNFFYTSSVRKFNSAF